MLELVKVNNKPIKYHVYENDVYLVEYDDDDTLILEEVKDIVMQGHCTGCTFRPNDNNCKSAIRGISVTDCNSAPPRKRRVYMRDEIIYNYESLTNVNVLSPDKVGEIDVSAIRENNHVRHNNTSDNA